MPAMWRLLCVLVLCAAAAAVGPALAGAGDAAPPAAPAIEFVLPPARAFIPSGTVLVAGRLPEAAGFLNLILDGEPVTGVVREGDTFSATLTPRSGTHTLEARAGGLSASLPFSFGTGGRSLEPYRYHTPVLEKRCAECHAGIRHRGASAEAETCRSCHRRLAVIFPYLHGPVAAGKCVICHDPHGSSRPALTRTDARTMCTSCHDQPGSLAHVEQARSQVCYLCHNPHASMNKKFLYDIVR